MDWVVFGVEIEKGREMEGEQCGYRMKNGRVSECWGIAIENKMTEREMGVCTL